MRIAILTIQSINYGNRLQNYALQTVLEGLGHSVESLKREPGLKGSVKSSLLTVKRAAGLVVKHRGDKVAAFKSFDKSNVSFSKMTVSAEYVSPSLSDAYDCFVIGSDQVWNPDFDFNSDLDYLPMISVEKKVAYAASFGVDKIVSGQEETAALLNGIEYIAMREAAGARIVRELTGRDVPVVLDPTLLLDAEAWAKVAKRPKTVDCSKPFVFKYVLGNDVNGRRIEELAEARGLGIVDVMDESLSIGPSEFVWLVANSELVCTDSFHASVFALLHHKPLAIFERVCSNADMSSRFDTLCSAFGLEGHRSSEAAFGPDAIYGTDWADVDSRLAALRDDSLAWLKTALGSVARG